MPNKTNKRERGEAHAAYNKGYNAGVKHGQNGNRTLQAASTSEPISLTQVINWIGSQPATVRQAVAMATVVGDGGTKTGGHR